MDKPKKNGYCQICDEDIEVYTDDFMCDCPICGHHISLHEEDE